MRARNIKPSFFTNELLGTYDPIIQLLFAGLWCLADRDGRLEDRPLRIKAELFPYRESMDINGYLTVLERDGFLVRYRAGGMDLIQVENFVKHQAPHHTEKSRNYPPPTKENQGAARECVLTPLNNREHQVPTRSDSLIPDSLIPDSKTLAVAKAPAAPSVKAVKIGFDYETAVWSGLQENPELIASWQQAYPAVDLRSEFNKMQAWLKSNPANRKTNLTKFINNWLSKAQDRAGSPAHKTFAEREQEYKDQKAKEFYQPLFDMTEEELIAWGFKKLEVLNG